MSYIFERLSSGFIRHTVATSISQVQTRLASLCATEGGPFWNVSTGYFRDENNRDVQKQCPNLGFRYNAMQGSGMESDYRLPFRKQAPLPVM